MDIHSRYLQIELMRSKDKTYDAFSIFANILENNENKKIIRIFATNNGIENTNKRLKTLLDKKGINY